MKKPKCDFGKNHDWCYYYEKNTKELRIYIDGVLVLTHQTMPPRWYRFLNKWALFIIGISGIAFFWWLPGEQLAACALFGILTGIGLAEIQT